MTPKRGIWDLIREDRARRDPRVPRVVMVPRDEGGYETVWLYDEPSDQGTDPGTSGTNDVRADGDHAVREKRPL